MDGILDVLFAAALIGAGAAGLIRLRASAVPDRLLWLIGFAAFTAAGVMAAALVFVGAGIQIFYINVLGFAVSVGFVAFLIADASHLLDRSIPEQAKTIAIIIAVTIYGVAVFNMQPQLMSIATIVAAVGLLGLGISRYDAAPTAAIWTIIGGVGIGLLPLFAARFAGSVGVEPSALGHLALAIGVFAMMRAALAPGAAGRAA